MSRQIGVAVVVVLMTISEGALKTLFVRVDRARWALPSGELAHDEPLQKAAERVIQEQVGVQIDYLEQLFTFGNLIPSTGQRIVTVSYYGLVPSALLRTDQLANREQVNWFAEQGQPKLMADHSEIAQAARHRLQGKLAYSAVGFELLPETFTLVELQQLYEVILGKVIDKRNFRRKIFELGIVEETGKRSVLRGRGRPPSLFRFKPEVFKMLETKGDIFPF
jgi:8-oxo-dGTP diphosphatase